MTRYLIAKYVDDLSRNEPINIGVIVYGDEGAVARFDGETEAGKLDLRRVRNRVTGTQAFRAWVDYWRAVMDNPASADRKLKGVPPGDARAVEYLLAEPSRDFYLEHGGSIVLDSESPSLPETRDRLFTRLVRRPETPVPESLAEKSRTVLAAAGAPLADKDRFREQVPVSLQVEGVSFDQEVSYAVMNGDWHFLQEMPFDPGRPRRSNKEATHCAFLFEHSSEVREAGVILYDGTDIGGGQYRLLEMLMRYAPTVDVNRTDYAADALKKHLSLG
jgi:hypothetical protein